MPRNKQNPLLLGQDNNALTWLIVINAIVFIILNFLKIVYFLAYDANLIAEEQFTRQILNWVSLPANAGVLLYKPWTILTYMFAHLSVWALIGTLLWLWGFGTILQDLAGNTRLMPVYIYGGLAGALFFILTSNLIPQYSAASANALPFLGAGSAVMAVALAATTLAPDYRIFPMINGGIPLWVLTLIFVAIDYATIASSSGSYAVAHLAGGAIGFIFVKQLQKGNDIGNWMLQFYDWLNDLFNPEKKHGSKKKTFNFYKTERKPFSKTPRVTQQKLDDLLDKINQQGYQALTEEEKAFLKKASQEDI